MKRVCSHDDDEGERWEERRSTGRHGKTGMTHSIEIVRVDDDAFREFPHDFLSQEESGRNKKGDSKMRRNNRNE